MKRNIIALWIVLLLSLPVSAQQEKKKVVGFDVQLAQQIGLKNWSGVSSVDDGFPKASLTELKGVFNIRFGRSCVGAFADAGIGLMPAPKMGTFLGTSFNLKRCIICVKCYQSPEAGMLPLILRRLPVCLWIFKRVKRCE